jgi:hypothetical protein
LPIERFASPSKEMLWSPALSDNDRKTMSKTLRAGVSLLALFAVGLDSANAAHRGRSNCADTDEVSALQTAAVQQELMDAALGCGQGAVQKFNAFQTSYGPELRSSDKTLLTMFKRVYGPSRGDAQYNLFKTNMASKAEIRRVHGIGDFCAAADLVFAAALAPQKPLLRDFVSGVPVHDTTDAGVGSCDINVAVTLKGTMAGPGVVPTPNPLREAALFPQDPADAAPAPTPVAAEPPAPATQAAPQPQQQPEQPKKKSGWLSGLFH